MSAQSFHEFPFNRRDFTSEECFYCGRKFDTTTTFVQWRGNSSAAEVNLHADCARELSAHLASDYLKARQQASRMRLQI